MKIENCPTHDRILQALLMEDQVSRESRGKIKRGREMERERESGRHFNFAIITLCQNMGSQNLLSSNPRSQPASGKSYPPVVPCLSSVFGQFKIQKAKIWEIKNREVRIRDVLGPP